MKKYLLLTILLLLLASCAHPAVLPIARDIADVQLMRTIALDRGSDGKVKVTMSGDVRPGGEGGSSQPPIILTKEAETVFGAALSIQTYGDGYVTLGHIGQCVLSGTAAAHENAVSDLLDFIERDFETRISTDLYLTEEGQAADILTETASETQSATRRLESLRRDFGLESQGWPVTVREFLVDIEDNGCGMVPVLKLEEQSDGVTIVSSEMAWFRDGRFRGILSAGGSRGAAMLEEKLVSGAAELTLHDGTVVGLRMTGVKCRWEPVWEGDVLTGVKVKVKLTADLAEEQGRADFYSGEVMEEAERRLKGVVEGQLRELVSLTQEEGADLLHLRRRMAVKCPSRHREIEEHWEEWFPKLEVKAEAECRVERSYDISH